MPMASSHLFYLCWQWPKQLEDVLWLEPTLIHLVLHEAEVQWHPDDAWGAYQVHVVYVPMKFHPLVSVLHHPLLGRLLSRSCQLGHVNDHLSSLSRIFITCFSLVIRVSCSNARPLTDLLYQCPFSSSCIFSLHHNLSAQISCSFTITKLALLLLLFPAATACVFFPASLPSWSFS